MVKQAAEEHFGSKIYKKLTKELPSKKPIFASHRQEKIHSDTLKSAVVQYITKGMFSKTGSPSSKKGKFASY